MFFFLFYTHLLPSMTICFVKKRQWKPLGGQNFKSILHPCSTCRKHFPVLSSLMTYHRVCNQRNTTGATSETGTAYPSRAPTFTRGFQWGSPYSICSFLCSVLQIAVCPFVLFLLAIVLSVPLRFTDSDYPFGIFTLFLAINQKFILCLHIYCLIKSSF